MNTQALTPARWLRPALSTFAVAIALCAFAPTTHAQRGRRAAAAQTAETTSGVVNIQTASVDELQRLPGIGPSRAEAIVAQRERRAFRRIEDILRVRGVGRATFRRLRSMLTVDGPTTLAAPARASRSRQSTRASE